MPKHANRKARIILPLGETPIGSLKTADDPDVITLTVTAEVGPLRATELGDTEQVDIAGVPLQLNVTVWLNPPPGAMLTE
jgi:hypothetical protein